MRKRDMYIEPGKYMGRKTKRKSRVVRKVILTITVLSLVIISLWRLHLIAPGNFIFSLFDKEKEIVKSPLETQKSDLNESAEIHQSEEEIHQSEEIHQGEGEQKEKKDNSLETSANSQKPLMEELINKTMEPVRGIYVSGARAGINEYMQELISLTENTKINAMVIDIKNDYGEITYKTKLPLAEEIGAGTNYIKDIRELVRQLKEKDIYLIARIVSFKDPLLAKKRGDLSLKSKKGVIFIDKNGDSWVNPYNKEVWKYLIDIGKEVADIGFDEIQFDYIRFSTDAGMKTVNYGEEAENKSRLTTITEFTKYACDNLKPLGVKVSADVYGTIIGSAVDAQIVGQDYVAMAKHLDFICPMIYPSHYAEGSYGIDYPDMKPYETILAALEESKQVLEQETQEGEIAKVRPWLQDFTASWVKHHSEYGKEEISAQIQAVYDAGYTEWMLWNGSNNYTEAALYQ